MRDKTVLAQSAELTDAVAPTFETVLKPLIKEARKTLNSGRKLAKAQAKAQAKTQTKTQAKAGAKAHAKEAARKAATTKPGKRRKLKALLVFGIFGGLAAAVYKVLTGSSDWQSEA